MYYSTAATVDIVLDRLNLKSGGWLRAYIELQEGFNASDINVSSILLNGTISVHSLAHTQLGDFDRDRVPDLMVKFSKPEVRSYILETMTPPKPK